ncbi:hypothetical protein ABH941_006663 [Streptacidiphilus sp. EB103A]
MGAYLRSSLKAGPFRFNLSKSGIGVSTGVPGFRIGTSPRGNYVRVGGRGVSYRATLPSQRSGARQLGGPAPQHWSPGVPELQYGAVAVQEIPTATIEALQGSNQSDFVAQLQAAAQRRSVWTWVLVASLLISLPLALLPMLLLGPLVYWLYLRDRAAQSVVAFYDLESGPAEYYGRLVDAAGAVQQSHKNWAVTGSGAVRTTTQYKVNSGVDSIVKRKAGKVNMNGPQELVTNIAVPSFHCGDHQLFLLPDRVLVKHRRAFADLPYQELSVFMDALRFHEKGAVPRDSQQVGTTWQFVNKKGGPDRRYKNNPRLRIMQYGRLTFATRTGMNLQMQCSRPEAASQFAHAVKSYVVPAQAQGW